MNQMLQQGYTIMSPVNRRESIWSFASTHKDVLSKLPFGTMQLQCNLPLLLFVSGQGNQGKSTITQALSKKPVLQPLERLSLDVELINWYSSIGKKADGRNLNLIYDRFYVHPAEEEEFASYVANKFQDSSYTILVIEGCGLNRREFQDLLHAKIGSHLDALKFEVSKGSIYFENTKVVDAVAMRSPQTITDPRFSIFDAASSVSAHNLMVFIQHLYANYLQDQSTFQCYNEIENCWPFSNAASQYKLLNIPNLENKTALDVDCNEGYYATHMAERANKVVCLEPNTELIHIAECYGRIIMGSSSLSYRQQSFLDYKGSAMFDVILAIEYPKYNTELFLAHAAKLLKTNGVLLIQIPSGKVQTLNLVAGFRAIFVGPGITRPGAPSSIIHLSKDSSMPSVDLSAAAI